MKRIIPFLVVINLILCSCAGKNNDGVEDSLKEPELYEQIDVPTSNEADKYEETTSQQEYIGNINTGKFHYFTCKYLPDKINRIYFTSREEAVSQHFVPCQKCLP